jgi:septal ring factor EnvC (AmiA/AmiB activator)
MSDVKINPEDQIEEETRTVTESVTITEPAQKPKTKTPWKFFGICSILGLAVAIVLLGLQSYQLTTKTSRLKVYEQKVLQFDENKTSLEEKEQLNSELTSKLSVVTNDLDQKNKLISDTKSTIEKREKEIKDKEDKFALQLKELEQLRTTNANLKAQNDALSGKVDSIRAQLGGILK